MTRKNNRMLAKQRRREILNKVKEGGSATTAELSEIFSVSEITIRKDLDQLAEKGLLERTHGGAVKRESTVFEPSHDEKALVHMEEKERIGKKAAVLIKDNSTIFLSTGTTTMQIIPYLNDKENLTVLTNSLNNGFELAKLSNLNITIIGGDLRRKSLALVGPLAEENFENIYVDQLFLGVNGISIEHGLTTPTIAEAKICRLMIKVANKVIVIADHSKFEMIVHGKIEDIQVVDTIITDDQIENDYLQELQSEVNEVLIVS